MTTVVIFGPLLILIARAQKVSPVPYLLAAALLTDTGGVGTLVGDPPNIMIGSAAEHRLQHVLPAHDADRAVAWLAILVALEVLFRKELAGKAAPAVYENVEIKDPQTWRNSLIVLGVHGRAVHDARYARLGRLVRRRDRHGGARDEHEDRAHGARHAAGRDDAADVLRRAVHGHRRGRAQRLPELPRASSSRRSSSTIC